MILKRMVPLKTQSKRKSWGDRFFHVFSRHQIWPREGSTVQWKWSPPSRGSLKALLFPPLLNKVQNNGTQGAQARYDTELPPFISIVWYPGRPVILGMDFLKEFVKKAEDPQEEAGDPHEKMWKNLPLTFLMDCVFRDWREIRWNFLTFINLEKVQGATRLGAPRSPSESVSDLWKPSKKLWKPLKTSENL